MGILQYWFFGFFGLLRTLFCFFILSSLLKCMVFLTLILGSLNMSFTDTIVLIMGIICRFNMLMMECKGTRVDNNDRPLEFSSGEGLVSV